MWSYISPIVRKVIPKTESEDATGAGESHQTQDEGLSADEMPESSKTQERESSATDNIVRHAEASEECKPSQRASRSKRNASSKVPRQQQGKPSANSRHVSKKLASRITFSTSDDAADGDVPGLNGSRIEDDVCGFETSLSHLEIEPGKSLPEWLVMPGKVPDRVKHYWRKRHMYFSRFDEGIMTDDVGLFSVTPECIAQHHAKRLAGPLAVDLFCGIGGNTIQLAFTCDKVIGVDNSAERLWCAQNNAKIYGVDHKIEFVLADVFEWVDKYIADTSMPRASAVFASPPWGGIDYKKLGRVPYRSIAINLDLALRRIPDTGRSDLMRDRWPLEYNSEEPEMGAARDEGPEQSKVPAQDEEPEQNQRPVRDERPAQDEEPAQDERPAQDEEPAQDQRTRPAQNERPTQDQRPTQNERPAYNEPTQHTDDHAGMRAVNDDTPHAKGRQRAPGNWRDMPVRWTPPHAFCSAYRLSNLEPGGARHIYAAMKAVSPNVAMFVPRNCDLNDVAHLDPDSKIELEENASWHRVRGVTLYFGDLPRV